MSEREKLCNSSKLPSMSKNSVFLSWNLFRFGSDSIGNDDSCVVVTSIGEMGSARLAVVMLLERAILSRTPDEARCID